MKFSLNQQDLQKSLNYCQGVIEKRSTLPILSNVLLDASESKLTIVATDLDLIFIHQILNVEILEEGKTTTTSMVGTILKAMNLDPTIIVGGVVKSLESNSVLGGGDTFVVEADEYNKSLLHLSPTIAVINNIDFEHIECYNDIDDLKDTFLQFANSVPFYGTVCACKDSKNVASILSKDPYSVTECT